MKEKKIDSDEVKLAKIEKASRLVMLGCKVLGVLTAIALVIIGIILFTMPGNTEVREGLLQADIDIDLSGNPWGRIFTLAPFVLLVALFYKGLYHLHHLFRNFSEGQLFTADSVAQIRKLGYTFLWRAVVIFLDPLFRLIAIATNGGGNLKVHAEGTTLEALFLAGILILLSWVMDTARGLREENELTV